MADPSLRTRLVTDDDQEFLYELYAASRFDFSYVDWPSEDLRRMITRHQFDAQRTDYRKRYPDSRHEIILRNEAGGEKRAGRIWTAYLDDHIHILDINILPVYRNRGIGTHILRKRQEEASSSNRSLRHYVDVHNEDARRLYRRLNFTVIKDIETHLLMEWTPKTISSP